MSCLKFGAYRTMYNEVIEILLFTARQSKWRSCHAHTVNRKQKILVTFHVAGVKDVHKIFHDIQIKFVGGVHIWSVFARAFNVKAYQSWFSCP